MVSVINGLKYADFVDCVDTQLLPCLNGLISRELKTSASRSKAIEITSTRGKKEADGEAAKYGNDIVFMAEFANSRGQFMSWITVSSSTQGTLPTLRGFEAGFDSLAAL